MSTNRLDAALTILMLALPAGGDALAARSEHALELGAGVFVPFSGDNRDDFGTGGALQIGLASRLGWKSTWLVADAGFIRSRGQDFPDDDTFETPDSECWVIPVTLGVRVNASSEGETLPVRLYLGTGFLTVFTSYEPAFGESSSTPAFGGMAELRTEISLGSRSNLYIRQRVALMTDVDYESRTGDLNHSGTVLDAGLNYRLR
jgi:hypothetical protein